MSFSFTIVTPQGVTYQDKVEQVSIPTIDGEITVLEGHATLIAVLKPGELRIGKAGYSVSVAVSGGVVEMRHTGDMYVLADTAERAEHIDLERAEAAKKRAEELLHQVQQIDGVEFARMQAMLEKEMARVRIGKKYRNL